MKNKIEKPGYGAVYTFDVDNRKSKIYVEKVTVEYFPGTNIIKLITMEGTPTEE